MIELTQKQKLLHSTLIAAELSQSIVFDIVQDINRSTHNRFGVKHELTKLKRKNRALATYIVGITGECIDTLADAADKADEVLCNDIAKMRLTCKNALDRHGAKESSVFASIITAQIVCNVTMGFVDAYLNYCKIEDKTDATALHGFDLVEQSRSSLVELSRMLCAAIHQDPIDLSNSPEIKISALALINRLKSAEFLNKILN